MRKSGILMPVASLPGGYGIGTLGKPARDFVDFLKKAGQSVWQILPLSPTGFGDSPYQSCSAFAGNPYFIDLDILCAQGLLEKNEYVHIDFGNDPESINYAKLYQTRFAVLRQAFKRFSAWYPDEYYHFCYEQGWWLEDYALYMTAKGLYDQKSYLQWPESVRAHTKEAIGKLYAEHETEVHFWKFCQYQFSLQWAALKAYANENGVEIMGDIPIYVSPDSADIWAGPELFLLDANGQPSAVAGCPPDYFAPDGQLWGNPLYDWNYHEKTKFAWWVRRIEYAAATYDIVRIDHFRAFDTYYAIPYGEKTAKNGVWKQGPGMKLFHEIKARLGEVNIVAEDLGLLFESVQKLLAESGFPGMKVLQFAFDPGCDSEYLPHNHVEKSVVYTGTHDNTTIADWLETAEKKEFKKAAAYLGLNAQEGYVQGMLRGALASVGALCIIPLQDWLGLGAQARINTPSTLGGRNWMWRAAKGQVTANLAKKIRAACALYGRV